MICESLVIYVLVSLCLLNSSILIKLSKIVFVNSVFVLFLRLSLGDIVSIR